MTAYAESTSTPLAHAHPVSMWAYTWHGVRAGLLGALSIALWFFFLDYSHGRPLYTPTLLGTTLMGGGGILPPAVTFSLVHTAVFILIGIAAARLVGMIEEGELRRLGLAAILLFVILDLGFSAFALTARAIGLEALYWPDVLLGNAIAAAVMMTYLWRRRPHAA